MLICFVMCLDLLAGVEINTTTTTTVSWPFVRDHPSELVPEETPLINLIISQSLSVSSIYHDP